MGIIQSLKEAHLSLKGHLTDGVKIWIFLFLTNIVVYLLTMACNLINVNKNLMNLISLIFMLITYPIYMGIQFIFLDHYRNQGINVRNFFKGYRYFKKSCQLFLFVVLLCFFFSILLVFPVLFKINIYIFFFFFFIIGIHITVNIMVVSLIFRDFPDLSFWGALKKSISYTNGHSFLLTKLFLFNMLISILSVISLFIGLFWLASYMQLMFVSIYDQIKQEKDPDNLIITDNESLNSEFNEEEELVEKNEEEID